MLVHERWVHVHGRRVLVGKTIVLIYPVSRWPILLSLGHWGSDTFDQVHVWMSRAPVSNLAVCWGAGTLSVWEDTIAAVASLSSVDEDQCKQHHGER